MSSKEYGDWVTFYRLWPWTYGDALLACLISNLTRGKDAKPAAVADFMPGDSEPFDPLAGTLSALRKLAQEQ